MIVRLRASVVCVESHELLCVCLRDPSTGVARLFVPGGRIEPGESALAAAERETLEETGYGIELDPASELVARYLFVWDRRQVHCTTHFFRARLRGDKATHESVRDAAYNEGVVWLPLERLEIELGFHSAILRAVASLALGSASYNG